MFGFSWGSLNSDGVGFYMSHRSNLFFYGVKDNIEDHKENDIYLSYVTDNNLNRSSKAFITFGITRKIQYPVWFYSGLGFSYYSESKQLTLQPHYDNNTKKYVSEVTTVWAKDPNAVAWGLNPEVGIMFNLWGFTLSAGINQPLPFKTGLKPDKFSPQFSFTIGGAWER